MAKNILAILIFVAIVIILLWGWPGFLNKKTETNNNSSTTKQTNVPSGSQTQTKSTTTTKKSPSQIIQESLTYTDAINAYDKIGRRIQFDPNCQAIPSKVSFKKGTKVMLDNRSSQARPIYLDGKRYNLAAYGFQIVTLTTTASLPHTIQVDCGTGKNNGQIIIQ